jgi:hypothetical protein
MERGRIPYQILSARTPAETPPQPVYLDFRTIKPVSETQFLTAIVPVKTQNSVREFIKQMTEIAGENLKGIRVTRGNEIDSVMFRTGLADATIRQSAWSGDAAVLAVTESARNLKMFAVQNARWLQRGSQILFSSEQPASVAVNFNSGEIDAVCNAETATKIALFIGRKPIRVLLDGRELKAYEFKFNLADSTISLISPAGQHDLLITFR